MRLTKINYQIGAPQVRLVQDGTNYGVVSIQQAREQAKRAELDLVEIVPNANPPVCSIMDYGKWKYEQKIKQKEEQKKHKHITPKEIRLRYCIAQHDIETKTKHLKEFLQENRQVRLVVRFTKRELAFANIGENVLMQMIESVKDLGEIQHKPRLEGKNMIVHILPKH